MQETRFWSLGWEDPLEEKMATHSSILAWKIPWTEKPGRLQSIGLQSFGHNWSNLAHMHSNQCKVIHKYTIHVYHISYISCISLIYKSCRYTNHFRFYLCFSNNEQCWISSCSYWPSVCTWRNTCLGPIPIFFIGLFGDLGFFFFFPYWVVWAVCIFWKLTSCLSHHLRIFPPIP